MSETTHEVVIPVDSEGDAEAVREAVKSAGIRDSAIEIRVDEGGGSGD